MGFFRRFFTLQLRDPAPEPKRFDLKKIKDGLYRKLFKEDRIDYIKGLNKKIDKDISNLKEHVLNFNKKIELLNIFLNTGNTDDFERLTQELQNIRKLVSREYDEDKKEDIFILKALQSINDAVAHEKDLDIEADEYGIQDVLKKLRKDIENLEPVLVRQLKFFEMPREKQQNHIKELLFDIREEAAIIGYEKKLIKSLKIDINKFEIKSILAPEE